MSHKYRQRNMQIFGIVILVAADVASILMDVPLLVSLVLMLTTLVVVLREQRKYTHALSKNAFSFFSIRNSHTYGRSYHVVMGNMLIALFCVLSVQFVAKVYAMSFTLQSTTSEVKASKQVFFADIDGDGDPDAVVFNVDVGDTYKIDKYINAAGTFSHGGTFGYSNFNQASAGDIDGDGDIDFVMSYSNGLLIHKLVNNGSGVFTGSDIAGPLSPAPEKILLIDVDSDGDLDVLAGGVTDSTVLLLNDGKGSFSSVATTLPAFQHMASGDFDSDGDLDLILTESSANAFSVYKNSGTGAFTFLDSATTQPGHLQTHASVGDLDGDGDLDVVISTNGGLNIPLLNNGAGSFALGTNFSTGGGALYDTGLGDWDNDGDIDALSSGKTSSDDSWLNNGSATFTLNTSSVEANYVDSIAIADIDADGDLDYTIANRDGATGVANRFYVSDQAATLANTAPTAPSSFSGVKVSDNGATAVIRLSWGSGSDSQTPTKLLQYQLKLGTGSNTNNYVSGVTASPNWVTRLMPNGQSRKWLVKNLPCRTGLTYYWSVAAMDTGFKKTWSTEQTFTLDSSCVLSGGGGGGSGGGTTGGSSGGGGGAAWLQALRQSEKGATPAKEKATLSVLAFGDISGNGTRETLESTAGFKGLPVTIEGKTEGGKSIKKTITMDAMGTMRVMITPGTYKVTVDDESLVVRGQKPTTHVVFEDVVLTSGDETSLAVGFQEETLLRHAPCLQIGSEKGAKGKTDAETLLLRLQNATGRPVTSGIALGEFLMTRRTFFRLLTSMHCIDVTQGESALKEKLRTAFDSKEIPDWSSIELRDLKISPLTEDSRTVYGLLAEGVPVVRASPKGSIADLSSPISRADAVSIVTAILKIPEEKRASAGILPEDVSSTNPILGDLFTLQSFGVVPESFLPIFGPLQGMNMKEASLFLVRSSFRAGRIDLLPEYSLKSAARDSFLKRELPTFALPKEIMKDPLRPDRVSFTDVLPGDDLYTYLRAALAFGVKNKAKETLWLVTATLRPTEFGVDKGQTQLRQNEPVTLFETIRALDVLSGVPPPTRAAVVTGADRRDSEGTGERRATIDQIANLPRDGSTAARIFYRAQDSIGRAYNTSVVLYATSVLSRPFQSPMASLSIDDAADLFASALIGISVRQGEISPQDADKKMLDLRTAIVKDLAPESASPSATKNMLFTKGMFTKLLGTIVLDATNGDTKTFATDMSPGMFWWHRVSR